MVSGSKSEERRLHKLVHNLTIQTQLMAEKGYLQMHLVAAERFVILWADNWGFLSERE